MATALQDVAVTKTGREFAEGSEVGLDFDLQDLYLFDANTEKTLCCGLAGSS